MFGLGRILEKHEFNPIATFSELNNHQVLGHNDHHLTSVVHFSDIVAETNEQYRCKIRISTSYMTSITLGKFCSQKRERTIICVTVHYETVSVKDYQGIKRVIFLSYYLGPKYEMKPENIF